MLQDIKPNRYWDVLQVLFDAKQSLAMDPLLDTSDNSRTIQRCVYICNAIRFSADHHNLPPHVTSRLLAQVQQMINGAATLSDHVAAVREKSKKAERKISAAATQRLRRRYISKMIAEMQQMMYTHHWPSVSDALQQAFDAGSERKSKQLAELKQLFVSMKLPLCEQVIRSLRAAYAAGVDNAKNILDKHYVLLAPQHQSF